MIATEAAWRTGEAWLDALLPYLAGNRDLFDARIEAAAPGARSMRLDATYLAWVDFSGTGLAPEDVAARVAKRARIFASPGPQFGPGGETWLRFNFATPRPILEEALGRLDDAFADLRAGSESQAMKRPVVGVIASTHLVENRFAAQRVGERNLRAVADVAGALPIMFAGTPEITEIGALLDVVDGVLLTGAPRQRSSDPFRRRAASQATNPTTSGATRWRWHWSRSASPAACRCSASAAAFRR